MIIDKFSPKYIMIGLSSMMLCKLYRQDASVAGDIAAWQFDIHYEIDSIGSSQLYIK